MNRQRFLIGLLILVIVTMLPVYIADRTTAHWNQQLAELNPTVDLLRQKALKSRELEQRLARELEAGDGLEERLINTDPFAVIHRELTMVGGQTGMRVVEVILTGAQPIEGLPSLVEYTAEVQVEGATVDFIRFLERLERHPLLIGIPDLKLQLPQASPEDVASITATLQTRLTLHFYAKAPGSE